MLHFANLFPPEEIKVDAPSTYLPIIQVVLIGIGVFAVWLYARRSAQLAAAAIREQTYTSRAAPNAQSAALGVNSLWSLCGPWL